MSTIRANVYSTVDSKSFRVQQIAGMLDVALEKRMGKSFEVELPELAEDWRVGVIVGSSGSGKSTVARAAFVSGGVSRLQPRQRRLKVAHGASRGEGRQKMTLEPRQG